MSSSGPSFRRWARGLKADIKDGFKGLVRSTTPSRSSTPDPRPAEAARGVEGISNANEHPQSSSTVKDGLKVSLNFTQTLLKRLPEIVDGNPVNMALSLAKVILEIKEAVKDNMDAVERRIASTGAQLEIVADTRISRWEPNDPEKPWLDRFKQILAEELMTLRRLGNEWLIRKIANHENEKSQIAATLERVNDARMQFELYTNI